MSSLTLSKLVSPEEDWTFRKVSTREYSHGFHTYPARMHPEIARQMINKYASDTKKIVFDPFMGSGSVLVEGILHGNNSIGIDINPFAVFLSDVKTTPINSKKLENTFQKIVDLSQIDLKKKKFHSNAPNNLDLSTWYPKNTLKLLQILKHHIFNISNNKERNFFKMCFSLTTRRSSYQHKNTYKIYRMKLEQRDAFMPNVFNIFTKICKNNMLKMQDLHNILNDSKAKAYPLFGDTRNIPKLFSTLPAQILDEEKVHLVVTSPPYGDHSTTVAYGQFSRHPGLWLELKEEELYPVDKIGLGGRQFEKYLTLDSPLLEKTLKKVQKKDEQIIKKTSHPSRAKDVFAYFYDLDKCLKQIAQVLKQGESHCCFVVANRKVRRETIPTDQIIIEIGKKYGFKYKETIHRRIINKAMATKNTPENITNYSDNTMNTESIVVWKF